FKAKWGWHPNYLIDDSGSKHVAALFLARKIAGLGQLWYSPNGPGIIDPTALPGVLQDRSELRSAFALKVEPNIEDGADTSTWTAAGLVKAAGDVQRTRATIIVDLRPEEDALLASFKPKTRYNIRLAA